MTEQSPVALRQSGFSLITAIFLLVVLATLMGYMINLRVVQQATVVMAVQGARALQAARSGIQYGVFLALGSDTCNASDSISFTSAEPALEPFTVSVYCSRSSHTEGSTTINFYEISALAENGSFAMGVNANPDYVSRRIRVTVSAEPP